MTNRWNLKGAVVAIIAIFDKETKFMVAGLAKPKTKEQ
jgi:hypothetical protein